MAEWDNALAGFTLDAGKPVIEVKTTPCQAQGLTDTNASVYQEAEYNHGSLLYGTRRPDVDYSGHFLLGVGLQDPLRLFGHWDAQEARRMAVLVEPGQEAIEAPRVAISAAWLKACAEHRHCEGFQARLSEIGKAGAALIVDECEPGFLIGSQCSGTDICDVLLFPLELFEERM